MKVMSSSLFFMTLDFDRLQKVARVDLTDLLLDRARLRDQGRNQMQ
jgi:hypothetical protein